MTTIDIRALAKLARLDVTDEEVVKLEQEIPSILGFVETIQKAQVSAAPSVPTLRTVMRADENPHEAGAYTEALLSGAPAVKNGRVIVKQVVSRKSAQGGLASGQK